MSIRIAHLSDTHLGLETYQARTAKGLNMRGADMHRALHNAAAQINTWDPPLVIHSGDVFEHPAVAVKHLLGARAVFTKLTTRTDGTPRGVVIISGNHDTPRNTADGCQLELLKGFSSGNNTQIRVVSYGYEQLTFDPADGYSPELTDVVVHALPHDSLRDPDILGSIDPVEGKTNILVAHGVVGGDLDFKRMIGREYAIPQELLAKRWDYVALGHWHTQGPVSVAGNRRYAYYAGSTECVDFSDMKNAESVTSRAWLQVTVKQGEYPDVQPESYPTRRMLAPPPIDARDKTPTEIADALLEQLKALDAGRSFETDSYDGAAVVRQRVWHLNRDIWALVDLSAVRVAAESCLHHRVEPKFESSTVEQGEHTGETQGPDLGDLAAVLNDIIAEEVAEPDRAAVLEECKRLLGAALGTVEDDTEPETTPPEEKDDTEETTDKETSEADPVEGDEEPAEAPSRNEPPEATTPADQGDVFEATMAELGMKPVA